MSRSYCLCTFTLDCTVQWSFRSFASIIASLLVFNVDVDVDVGIVLAVVFVSFHRHAFNCVLVTVCDAISLNCTVHTKDRTEGITCCIFYYQL